MALRRIDILASGGEAIESLEAKLCDAEVDIHERICWPAPAQGTGDRNQPSACLTLVVSESDVDEVLGLGETVDGNSEPQWRAVVSPVLATLPRSVNDEGEDDEPEQNADSQTYGWAEWIGWLGLRTQRVSRDEIITELEPGSRVSSGYLLQSCISSLVAAIGMWRNDVAVVIAAMVIAPLLRPSMSLALGTTLGDLTMLRRSVLTTGVGLGATWAVAWFAGLMLGLGPNGEAAEQLYRRAAPAAVDSIVAVAAGAAGALAVTSGLSAAMIGVMVAVALVPPVAASGLYGSAGDWSASGRAATLVSVNLACVNLAAVIVFWAVQIRPGTWYEEKRAKRARFLAIGVWTLAAAVLVWLITWFTQTPSGSG